MNEQQNDIKDVFYLYKNFQKHQKNRILVVDDEEFCIAAMRALLFKMGIDIQYQVDYAINGLEALSLVEEIQRNNMSYQLIFTDFNMPVMNGIEATSKIREKFNMIDQPCIIGVTGHVHKKFRTEGQRVGMDEIIAKPVYFSVMENIFKKYYHIEKWFLTTI